MDAAKKKILIVDDEPVILKLVDEILKSSGYDVVKATDGLDAMVLVKKEKPDLLVLDIMMPEINGYDVCRHIKFDNEFKDLPVLILTSREQELDPRIGQMMAIDYIQKPLKRDLFLQKIQKLLNP